MGRTIPRCTRSGLRSFLGLRSKLIWRFSFRFIAISYSCTSLSRFLRCTICCARRNSFCTASDQNGLAMTRPTLLWSPFTQRWAHNPCVGYGLHSRVTQGLLFATKQQRRSTNATEKKILSYGIFSGTVHYTYSISNRRTCLWLGLLLNSLCTREGLGLGF